MELRRLRYFLAVADELHFTRAAERLHIAQPALSQQIGELERELGVRLLERSRHGVQLTDPGRVFLDRARRIVEAADEARLAARRAGRGQLGRIVVAYVPAAAGDLVPTATRAFRADRPDVDVALRELNTAGQIAGLLGGDVHIGLLHDRVDPDRFVSEALRRERFIVALPAGHPLAARRRVALADLADETFIGMETRYSAAIRGACAKVGFVPKVADMSQVTSAKFVMVAAGLGIAVAPESARHLRSRAITYRQLEGPLPVIELFAVHSRQHRSPFVGPFLEALRLASAVSTAAERAASPGGAWKGRGARASRHRDPRPRAGAAR